MADPKLIVQTCSGPVQGIKKTSIMGDNYYAFFKIPYAKPPLGELRFKDPQPADPWTETVDGTEQGPGCPGLNFGLKFYLDEDCLHVNVFTKKLKPVKPLPVMVWIHGGAFMRGTSGGEFYNPEYLLSKNIVFISMNYRLGVFGFLSLEDESVGIPGNAGLKDQCLAIKWAKENCARFGGDPNNITLFGESAGGASVHYHMISEMSRDLFHKAIVMSGTVLSNWSTVPKLNFGERLALRFGWDGEGGDNGILNTLRERSADEIIEIQETVLTEEERKNHIMFPCGPTIELYESDQCFIPKDPLLMTREAWSHSIPIMIGGTSEEGLFSYREAASKPNFMESLDFAYFVPSKLNLARDDEKCIEFGKIIQNYYFGSLKPTMDTIDCYVKLMTDKLFWHGVYRSVFGRLNAPNPGPTYLYRFCYDSPTFNHFRLIMCGPGMRGTCHADDLSYLFRNMMVNKLDKFSPEYKVIQRMVGIWTKFAETSNPNCDATSPLEWKPAKLTTEALKCFNIGTDISFINLPETERMRLWDSMFPTEELY